MGQAIVVYEQDDLIITIDSDVLETLTQDEIDKIIVETKNATITGESDFFEEMTQGPNPKPVYRN